jgi:hypothetical protein
MMVVNRIDNLEGVGAGLAPAQPLGARGFSWSTLVVDM